MGLAGWANALVPVNEMQFMLLLGNVEFDVDDDDRLLFRELGLVVLPPILLPPTPQMPRPCVWLPLMMLGAEVFKPSDGVGIAGFMKRSLVRRPWNEKKVVYLEVWFKWKIN